METLLSGYNGERSDPFSGVYHLGNGYRAYNPVLMRFTCPDDLSPFGAGGINPYAYCAGDPVNHADPTGHLSWQSWLGIGMGILGLGLAVFSAGSSIAAAGSVMAAIESASATSMIVGTTGAVSDVTAIASGVSEGVNPKASAILGWVSLGFGAVGLVHGIYTATAKTVEETIKLRRVRTIMADSEQRAHRLLRRSSAVTSVQNIITESARIGPEGSAYILGMGEHSVADYALALESANNELFVVAHGAPGEVQIDGGFMNSAMFAEHLSDNVNSELNEYGSITLAICDSGSGPNSIGEAISHLAGRNTTVRAFTGNIEASQTEFGDVINHLTSNNIRHDLTNMLIRRPSLFDFDFHYRREQLVTWPR